MKDVQEGPSFVETTMSLSFPQRRTPSSPFEDLCLPSIGNKQEGVCKARHNINKPTHLLAAKSPPLNL